MKFTLPVLAVVVVIGAAFIIGANRGYFSRAGSGIPPSETSAEAPAKPITLTVSSPANGATVTNATITITGQTLPGAEVSINDVETTADAQGNFSGILTLDEGDNDITVSANDTNGNSAEQELTVTFDSGQ